MAGKREKKVKAPKESPLDGVKTIGKYIFRAIVLYALFMGAYFFGAPLKNKLVTKWDDFTTDVLVLGEHNFNATVKAEKEILVEFYAPWCGHCQRLKPEYDVAATKLKAQNPPIHIAKVDCTQNQELCKHHGIEGYPTLKIFSDGNLEESEKYSGALKADAIMGKMNHEVMSEPIPAEQGDMKKIVAKNFKELVLESDADVFVKFYAPWCGHCKSMAPTWVELAEKYKENKSLIIGDFDATANELQGEKYKEFVKGYPTLLWIPKGDKANPVKYSGARDLEGFEKWIKENASAPSAKDEL